MSALTFRNKLGKLVDIQSVPATRLKNELASVLDQAVRGGPVVITKHNAPRAVLISVEEFEVLVAERRHERKGGAILHDAFGRRRDGLETLHYNRS